MAAAKAPAPGEQLRALTATLASGTLPRGVILRGDERWFRESAIRMAIDAAQRAGLEVARHDAKDPDFDLRAAVGDLTEAPMFASARCVVIKSAAGLLKKEGDAPSALLDAAARFLAGKSPPGMVVLDADGLRADSVVVKKAIAAGAPVLDLRRLYDQPPPWERNGDLRKTELVQWFAARARERKVTLTADEAVYVCAATGNDLAALDNTLSRLAARGKDSVRSLVAWEAGTAPWDVAEQIARGDARLAVGGIETLMRGGFAKGGEREIDPGALLAMLMGSIRNKAREALLGARAADRGEDPIVAIAYKGHPNGRPEVLARIGSRPAVQWEALLEDFAALERKSRAGREAGGTVDAHDLVAFALRWRVERRAAGR
jgi:DNA polymerase III delta subunit